MNGKIFENCYFLEFPKYGDNKRGFLTVFEENKNIPFKIKRVYYIYEIGDLTQIRGPHGHKKTEQVFFNLNGRATYYLDNGKEKKEIVLDKPNIGLYIGPKVWHYIKNYSKNIVFLVVASTFYEESDYLRNYDDFLDFIKDDFRI